MQQSKNMKRTVFASALAVVMAFSGLAPSASAVTQPEADTPLNKENLQKLAVKGMKRLNNGVKLDLGTNDAYIRILDEDLAKVTVLEKGEKEKETPAISKKDWKTPRFSLKDKKDHYEHVFATFRISSAV